ncbi:serine/threonine-protein phosphatase 4 regulatory subunit 1-like isoform X1 [Haliotis rufescens]|uniref:serine/threonine-protein phosphatase 4 regulatory subunit 1-like isoform X1 n=2 Tax=Haliotis rufescens TaxID=6454 RepID=UPI001EB01489|nr:serine/threonine-protein phosphatase 4 regulatory subunit 1-like isoform X1 [Haliotis rufescens]
MADIEFYADDSDDTQDDGYGFDDGLGDDTDDTLSPLQRLQKYLDSDNIFNRQMVARGLLDTLRAVGTNEEEAHAVLKAMVKISEDSEPTVRSELMEQVPHIAVYCQENIETFENAVPTYILPMVVRYLNDGNNQVRKTSQAALLVLLEQELVDKADIEEQVIQVILDLACPDSLDDYRTEAVALMSKMAPLLGKDITERQFLSRYCEMCTDPLFHVRKVCAANFGELCAVVGTENTEEHMLPKFYYLCEDGVWGVRKACAECFMNVSCASSLEVRRNDLASLFVNLLCDQSRWVKMAAFQQLGPFISTFADPNSTGLVVNEDGSITFIHPDGEQQTEVEAEMSLKRAAKEALGCDIDDLEAELFRDERESEDGCSDPTDLREENMEIDAVDGGEEEVKKVKTRAKTTKSAVEDQERSVEEMRAEKYENIIKVVEEPVATDGSESAVTLEQIGESTDGDVKDGDAAVKPEMEKLEGEKSAEEASPESDPDALETKEEQTEDQQRKEEEETEVSEDKSNVKTSTSCAAEAENSLVSVEDGEEAAGSHVGHSEKTHVHIDSTESFNSFQFWRPPFPQVDLDFDLVDGAPTNIHITAKVQDDDKKVYATEMNVAVSARGLEDVSTSIAQMHASEKATPVVQTTAVEQAGVKIHTASVSTVSEAETVSHIGSTHVIGQQINEVPMAVVDGVVQDLSTSSISYIDSELSLSSHDSLREQSLIDDATLAQQQDIVPQSLLENYLGMVDPSRAQTVDTEITRHCAYNLPAVAYTLGRQNWHCIKNLYETLAQDMQVNEWKVRRTLAFSLHEMAMILGEEITHKDLVPVFDGFLKDLDEVRIGVLKHLADFLRMLRPDVRRRYLKKVQDFMSTDNHRNWRFRLELAVQLVLLCELYSPQDIRQYIVPMSLALASDKVSEVRHMAYRLLSIILHRMFEENEENLLRALVCEVIDKFALSARWIGRQIFAQICHVILEENSLPPAMFAEELLPSLLNLGVDAIPNVRLSMAKVLAQCIVPLEYFTSQRNPQHEELIATLQKLQADTDRDVRFFVSQHPETTLSSPHDTVSDTDSQKCFSIATPGNAYEVDLEQVRCLFNLL